jgi:hypothetical protein
MLKAFVIVVTACLLCNTSVSLGGLLGWQLPSSALNELQRLVPRNRPLPRETLESWAVQPRFFHFDSHHRLVTGIWYSVSWTTIKSGRDWGQASLFHPEPLWDWEKAQPLAALMLCVMLFALALSSVWVRWVGWPETWRGVDAARRRAVLLQSLWLSSLGLVVIVPVPALCWVTFQRIAEAANFDDAMALDIGIAAFLLNVLSVPVVALLISAHVLNRTIRCAARESDRRCLRCDGRLTKPQAATCPSCGLVEPQPFATSLTWLRVFTFPRGWNKWALLPWSVPALMLLFPVVWPQVEVLNLAVQKLLHG